MGRCTETESPAAGGGLLHRRALLTGAALSAGGLGAGAAGLARAQNQFGFVQRQCAIAGNH